MRTEAICVKRLELSVWETGSYFHMKVFVEIWVYRGLGLRKYFLRVHLYVDKGDSKL